MNKKKGVPKLVLIDCVHLFLLKQADTEGKIQRKEIPIVLGRGLHIQKENHRRILRELESFGIIIDSQKNFIEIKKKDYLF